jgi:MFS family permease
VLQLLRTNRSVRLLWLSQMISQMGNWFNTVAVLTLITQLTASAMPLSYSVLARLVPAVLIGPVAGVLADRWDRRWLMAGADTARAILALGFLLVHSPAQLWLLYILSAGLALGGAVFQPAYQALLPQLVPGETLARANALLSSSSAVMTILGAALGGLVSGTTGLQAAFVINALSFVVSVLGTLALRPPRAAPRAKERNSYWAQLVEGARTVAGNRLVLGIILVSGSWAVIGGGYDVVLTTFSARVFGLADGGLGLLYAVDGLGVILGGLVVARFIGQRFSRAVNAYAWAYLLQALFLTAFACSVTAVDGAFWLLLMRVASGVIIPLGPTLIQAAVPPDRQGRVFALFSNSYLALMQASVLLAGWGITTSGPRWTTGALGTVGAGIAAVFALAVLRGKITAPASPADPVASGD